MDVSVSAECYITGGFGTVGDKGCCWGGDAGYDACLRQTSSASCTLPGKTLRAVTDFLRAHEDLEQSMRGSLALRARTGVKVTVKSLKYRRAWTFDPCYAPTARYTARTKRVVLSTGGVVLSVGGEEAVLEVRCGAVDWTCGVGGEAGLSWREMVFLCARQGGHARRDGSRMLHVQHNQHDRHDQCKQKSKLQDAIYSMQPTAHNLQQAIYSTQSTSIRGEDIRIELPQPRAGAEQARAVRSGTWFYRDGSWCGEGAGGSGRERERERETEV
ncbi:hypothetical protein SVAN01_08303 [Stagonosporopsis vannaccii]|nr:hypothetical protein SVAN01_08303 [Stagonosporopsis vannaccii]